MRSVEAAVSTEATGPTSSLPNRISRARARAVLSSIRPAWISTIMPSFKSRAPCTLPSSSFSTRAALSSKRTPLTMIDPRPLIAPLVKLCAASVLVTAGASPPPPQATSSAAINVLTMAAAA